MKCKGCGATYDSQLEYCPYCGLENTRLKKERAKIQKRQDDYEKRKKQVLEENADEMSLRKLNRLMWIMLGLLGVVFVAMIGFFLVQEKLDSHFNQAEERVLEEMKEAGHWEALRNYLYQSDAEYTDYQEYWQLVKFSEDSEDLRRYRDEYLTLDRETYRTAFTGGEMDSYDRDYCFHHFEFLIDRILWDCSDILNMRAKYTGDSWDSELYGPITEDADARLRECEAEARVTLKMLFGMEDEDIAQLLEVRLYDDAVKAYADVIRERWLNEE